MDGSVTHKARKPTWLKVKMPGGKHFVKVRELVQNGHLHTVCESAHCPNIGECWSRRTATFMIMGDTCTRNCKFCAVTGGKPTPLDPEEPVRVAEAVKTLELKYAVITSVTRDDLTDGGAAHFAETIRAIRDRVPECKIEVLIPDFLGSLSALETVLQAQPDVLNHNMETVQRLYPQARPQADYQRSLNLLKTAHQLGAQTKTGIMVGLGETPEEVERLMRDVVNNHCKMLTIGQYLQPSQQHLPVVRYVPPAEFHKLKRFGLDIGFEHIESGPLVRSSYHADIQYESAHTADSQNKKS